jgi:hypothetical protein
MAGRLLSVGRRLLAVIAGAGSFTHVRDTAAQYGQGGPQGRGRRTRRCWPRWPARLWGCRVR